MIEHKTSESKDNSCESGWGGNQQSASGGSKGQGRNNDLRKMSTKGQSLYDLLDIPKTSTMDEIKKKYRKMALKYHPDKNPNNCEAEEMFKKINYAHTTLTDDKKRKLYDAYGSFGLYIANQTGDEMAEKMMFLMTGWFPCVFATLFCCSGCCCGCCFCCMCCCNFCCGFCKPKISDEYQYSSHDEEEGDLEDSEDANSSSNDQRSEDDKKKKEDTTNTSSPKADVVITNEPVVTASPRKSKSRVGDVDENTSLTAATPESTNSYNTSPKQSSPTSKLS